jgi:transcriptional regulator with XRE-family HTH domain
MTAVPIDTDKIETLRKTLKLTQAEAAGKAGLSGAQHWCKIVRGKQNGISVTTLEKIAKALGVKAKDLLK